MVHAKGEAVETAEFIRRRSDVQPVVGILTGTGLGDGADQMRVSSTIDYSHIPHMPLPTVQSHTGRLVLGEIADIPVILFQGRFHLYEGYGPAAVTFPIRILQELGVEHLILTNAAGGVCPDTAPGEIMIIRDHINLTGENPLAGPNDDNWGIRFPDMSSVYDTALAEAAFRAGCQEKIPIRMGVYAGLKGPSLETPAEIRFLKAIGADAVGFSTVQEAIVAVHARMRILGLSVITNVHDPSNPQPATVDSVIATAGEAAPRLRNLITRAIAGLDSKQEPPS